MMRVVVAGALANKPHNGGEAWVRLSWILGLRDLGIEVYFVEEISKDTCIGVNGRVTGFESSINHAWFRAVTDRFGLTGRCSLIYEGGAEVHGRPLSDLTAIAQSADLLVNISGHLRLPDLLERFGETAYVDLDPGFTQIWHAQDLGDLRLDLHRHHFTVGANVGRPGCSIPTGGFTWRPVRPPVLLDRWPVRRGRGHGRFTTVSTWRAPFGPLTHDGHSYGLKHHEFRKVLDLPQRSVHDFELALAIHPDDWQDRSALERHGWRLASPLATASEPEAFRDYVGDSAGEFSVAQGVYVETRSGWFSDRTARYLASGRPALVQDTGYAANHAVGDGLVCFRSIEEAVEGADRIMRDHTRHSLAARRLAEEHFDARIVLTDFLREVGLGAPAPATTRTAV